MFLGSHVGLPLPFAQKLPMSQPITIRGEEFTANVCISQTVSFASVSQEPAAPIIPVCSAMWEIPATDLAKRPAKGDTLIAQDGTVWRIKKVKTIEHRGIWQCHAYTPMTDFLPHDAVNIVRALAAISETDIVTTAWQRAKTNLSAKLIRDNLPAKRKSNITDNMKKLRLYFRDFIHLQKDDIVELPDGRQYKITRTRNSRHTHGWTELFLTMNPAPVAIR